MESAGQTLLRRVAAPPEPGRDESSPLWKAALASLREEFRARGWYRKATGRTLLELSFHVVLTVGSLAVFLASHDPVVQALAMFVSTVGVLGVATNTHTSSHHATSDNPRVNRLLTYFGYPFFLGLSATYWEHKHVVVHHPAPNVMGVDDDADLSPWFLLTEREVSRASGARRVYYRFQWMVIPFAIGMNGVNFSLTGWRYLIGRLRQRRQRTSAHWIDLAALGLHWACWVFVPMAFFPPQSVLAFYALRMALMGYAMFVVFAPGHFPAEAACLDADKEHTDFVALQTSTTLNFRTGFIARLFCSGLEHQIEHHLFPQISHVYYSKMSPLVEEFCRRQGYPYQKLEWPDAVWKSLAVFRTPKRVEKQPEALLHRRLLTVEEMPA